jgi:hypothetical protein
MFAKAIAENRDSIYAVLTASPLAPRAITPSVGTAFMVAPGLLVTAAHVLEDATRPAAPQEGALSVIRAPDIGRNAEPVCVVTRDDSRDLALLRVESPRSTACLRLLDGPVAVGTRCGSSGFPRILVDAAPAAGISLIELFQGVEICAFAIATGLDGSRLGRYETDSPIYGDAAGCPGFLPSGDVFGMYSRFVPGPPAAAGSPAGPEPPVRDGVSLWVPSMEIIAFAKAAGAPLRQ